MTETERLERWATALERLGCERLSTLEDTEYRRPNELEELRAANTALTVALADPILRAAGLRNDTFGEAARFFGLSNWQLHDIVCHCHFGETMSANDAAIRVRSMISHGRTGVGSIVRAAAGTSALLGLALAIWTL